MAISIVNLLLPAFEGIAKAVVSPFLRPLKVEDKIGNGMLNPFVKLLSPFSKKSVKLLFSTACLNFCVTLTCVIAFFTSCTDILLYNS